MQLSESTKNIFKALADFKSEFNQPMKDADNPFFKSKYVPLENVVDVIDETAPKFGLSYLQNLDTREDGYVGVQTIITHSSGEYIKLDFLYLKPDKATAQGSGSAITYARRYTLSSAFGVASDVDDDGNEASGNRKGKSQITQEDVNAVISESYKNIIQLDKIKNLGQFDTNEKINAWVKEHGNISDLRKAPKNEIVAWVKKLEKNVASYEG